MANNPSEAKPNTKEWVAEVRARGGRQWACVDAGTEPDTVAACRASVERKRSAYPDPSIEYRIRNVRTNEDVEV